MPTLERLAQYFRYLCEIENRNIDTISSAAIEDATGIHATQFRKDLSYFGEFGRPGIGYDVSELRKRLAKILKVDHEQPVLLVGAGNLGSALVGYAGLPRHNFHIVAAFDNNPNKIGRPLWGLEIWDVNRLKEVNADRHRDCSRGSSAEHHRCARRSRHQGYPELRADDDPSSAGRLRAKRVLHPGARCPVVLPVSGTGLTPHTRFRTRCSVLGVRCW
jgi:hypothetical protein